MKSIFAIWISLALFCIGCTKETKQEEEEEQEVFTGLEGKYLGGWTSETETTSFTDFPVSAIFRYSNSAETKMKGEFFATGSFASCCDKEDDGSITFDIEDMSIKNFNFIDRIVDCEGSFRGDGMIEGSDKFVIDFTGNDCDGNHVGVLIFNKR